MKIICTSDLHGYLPKIEPCDLLLVAGDICPVWNHDISYQQEWLDHEFREWLQEVPANKIIACVGNHDIIFEQNPKLVPKLPWIYLQDESVKIGKIKIYASPWQLRFYDWAFNLDEPELNKKFDKIEKCDILITHSPAFECGDYSKYENKHCGSKRLREKIEEHRPKFHIAGHFHSGYSMRPYLIGDIPSYNVSLCNERYQPINEPIMVEI
jgi:Icc-related predicted phosphoesterase